MNFNELVINRRSIRKYKDEIVPHDILLKIIDDSTYAPSSGNEQPWEFIIVSDKSLMKQISDDCKNTLLERINSNPDDYAKKYKAVLSREEYNIFYNAPSVIFIVGSKNLKNTEVNCTLSASYLMFSAANEGLGSCWISFGKFISDIKIKEKLGLTDENFIVAPIIVGYPDDNPVKPNRNTLKIKIVES